MADERLIPPGIRDRNSLAINDILDRIGNLDITPLLVYKIDEVIADVLPHLAEQFHVLGWEGWALAETEEARRELVRKAIALHRKKGTPWAVKQAVRTLGYECVIQEARDLLDAWTEAGGGFLDGIGYLDGSRTMEAQEGHFNHVPTSWAEYALDLDISVAEYGPESQRKIRMAAIMAAPARCHLIGLRFFLELWWYSIITHSAEMQVQLLYDECGSAIVPHFDIIGWGCREIGGTYTQNILDGSWTLSGWGTLDGLRPAGEPLNTGHWGTWKSEGTMPNYGQSFGGDRILTKTLDPNYRDVLSYLDGKDDLSVQTIFDEKIFLSGKLDLSVRPITRQTFDMLDGSQTLGKIEGMDSIWHSAFIDWWHGNQHYREVI